MDDFQFVVENYPPSITTEKVRWTLNYYQIRFEDARMTVSPQFIWTLLKRFPRFRKGPPYVIDRKHKLFMRTEEDVRDYFDNRIDSKFKLELDEAAQNDAQFRTIKQSLDLVSDNIRYWAYSYIIQDKELFLSSISAAAPQSQKVAARLSYPLIKLISANTLNPNIPEQSNRYQALLQAFDKMDAIVSDGRRYLVADRISSIDIEYCVSAAPCVMPPEYGGGGILPKIEQLPSEMAKLVAGFRSRPTGQFILRAYAEDRFKSYRERANKIDHGVDNGITR